MDILTLATSVIPDRSLGFTATVIIAGLGIVLGTLAVLIVVFYAFGAIMNTSQKAKNKKAKKIVEEAKPKQVIPTPTIPAPAPTPVAENGVSGEVVAAISAAIYEMEGAGAVVTSITPIRKQNPITSRNPWANAAVVENAKPFQEDLTNGNFTRRLAGHSKYSF